MGGRRLCGQVADTRVGASHADQAAPGDHPGGLPTSSATLPSLVVRMLRHTRLGDGLSLLDLGTGAGGLTAYACHRLGDRHVTSLADPRVGHGPHPTHEPGTLYPLHPRWAGAQVGCPSGLRERS